MFVERSAQYTSFSSRKQPANASTERKQFTENASVALQQPILTHAHTKCPPVVTMISNSRENTTSSGEIKLLGISYGSIILLFSYESIRGKSPASTSFSNFDLFQASSST